MLNADRLKRWAINDDPVLAELRGMTDPATKRRRDPDDLERRWISKANEAGGCGGRWRRERCRRCGDFRASLLVCNQRFCPECIVPRRRDMEHRVLTMLRAMPESCAVFPVVLTVRNGPLLGSAKKLIRKFKSFLRDDYIKRSVVGGGRKYEATHKQGHGPHPHLHALLYVRRRDGHRPRLEWAEFVSAWAHADAGDGSHCRCSRYGRRGKPTLCCRSSFDNTRKDKFDVCDEPECECTGSDVEPQAQHIDWSCRSTDHSRVAREIGKYMAKELADPDRYGLTDEDLADLLLEAHGLRAWQTFGVAYGADKLRERADAEPPACPESESGEPCDWFVHEVLPGDLQGPRPPPDYFEPIPWAS